MDKADAGLPVYPHLVTEFFTWIWFTAEDKGGQMEIDGEVCDVWVDERLSFRMPGEDKVRAVVTGEHTSSTLEARAALAAGKVVRDLELHLRREEREYNVTLRGLHMDLVGAKFPAHAADGGEDALLMERMYLYEDLWNLLGRLYKEFAEVRVSPQWQAETLPRIRQWVGEAVGMG